MPSELFQTVKNGLPPETKVLEAREGQKLTVDADVSALKIPYVVTFDGNVIMMGFTDRKESLTLEAGVHTVSWTFQHTEKQWMHKLRARVANKSFVTLEEKSEAKKDKPSTVGTAFVVVNAAS